MIVVHAPSVTAISHTGLDDTNSPDEGFPQRALALFERTQLATGVRSVEYVSSYGRLQVWFGIVIGLVPMALGVMFLLRRESISARSSSDPRWHVSECTALIGGIVLIVAGGLSLVSRFF
jgi:hypothetical protein